MQRRMFFLFYPLFSIIIILTGCSLKENESRVSQRFLPFITELYVDAVDGDDTAGNGSSDYPFKTITKALSSISETSCRIDTIFVHTGVYNQDTGEIFPLIIPEQIQLLAVPYEQPEIEGSGIFFITALGSEYKVTIVGNENVRITGFIIHSTEGIGIYCDSSFMIITLNILENSHYGILTTGDASPIVFNNTFRFNTFSSVLTVNSSSPILRRNVIKKSAVGITTIDISSPDIGFQDDPGKNVIRNNDNCDVCHISTSVIYALGNTWDDDPFFFHIAGDCTGGENIASQRSGLVIFQDIPDDMNTLFPNTEEIILISPERGSNITNDTPLFRWRRSGKKYVMAGLFRKTIEVSSKPREITNPEDMIWMWHTGLGQETEGYVRFRDGKTIIDGDINNPIDPIPLTPGRAYYWAVWAWNNKGIKITHSSKQNYFSLSAP